MNLEPEIYVGDPSGFGLMFVAFRISQFIHVYPILVPPSTLFPQDGLSQQGAGLVFQSSRVDWSSLSKDSSLQKNRT